MSNQESHGLGAVSMWVFDLLEARRLLAFGDENTSQRTPVDVDLGTIALPLTKTGSLDIGVGKDGSGGDSSSYRLTTYGFVLPGNAPSTIKFVLGASNPIGLATDYALSVYRDDGPVTPGVLDPSDDTQLAGLPTKIATGQNITTNPVAVSAGARYFIRMYANGDNSSLPKGQALVESTIAFSFSIQNPTPPFAALDGSGNLNINGTTGADVIDVSVSGSNVVAKLGTNTLSFASTLVKKVIVNAGDGNDSVNLRNLAVGSAVNGGNGNDTLIGGAGDDSFDGGAGADVVDGGTGGGNDDIHYFTRSEALTVTLDNTANDGSATDNAASGSTVRDNIKDNIEVIHGGNGNDRLVASNANNALAGNKGNDTLVGNGGNDVLLGGEGDDVLDGGAGADVFAGGTGNDTADYSNRTDALNISLDLSGSGSERVGNDGAALDGATGARDNVRNDVETILGGKGNDTLTGSAFNNRVEGNDGNDSVSGLDGNDTLGGGNGNDKLIGGNGNDLLDGGNGSDDFDGGVGTDQANFSARAEGLVISLDNQANDGSANDVLATGSTTRDNVRDSIEVVSGGRGNDRVTGSAFNNTLFGNAGNDTLLGAAGNDSLNGGDNDDLLDGGVGADVFAGGNGVDTADYSTRNEMLSITLDLAASGTQVVGNDGGASDGAATTRDNVRNDVEAVLGGKLADVITGSTFANKLIGGDGNDQLNGGDGADTLDGGNGNDVLRGGSGNDSLTGGAGTDALYGDAGLDWFGVKDALADTLQGGADFDTASLDSIDKRPLNDIERLT